jgi:hypothetical protein
MASKTPLVMSPRVSSVYHLLLLSTVCFNLSGIFQLLSRSLGDDYEQRIDGIQLNLTSKYLSFPSSNLKIPQSFLKPSIFHLSPNLQLYHPTFHPTLSIELSSKFHTLNLTINYFNEVFHRTPLPVSQPSPFRPLVIS